MSHTGKIPGRFSEHFWRFPALSPASHYTVGGNRQKAAKFARQLVDFRPLGRSPVAPQSRASSVMPKIMF
jgi:hypothetical protein